VQLVGHSMGGMVALKTAQTSRRSVAWPPER
jgi:pimeloyl-ACP methyl ester carboxylesterase